MNIEQSTLDACNGDKDKVFSIMQKTQQLDILANRNRVFYKLMIDGYTQKQIAEYWNLSKSAVSLALSKVLQDQNEGYSHEITTTLIDELTNSIPDASNALIYDLLKLKGFNYSKIGRYYNLTPQKVRNEILKFRCERDFEVSRKRIVKF